MKRFVTRTVRQILRLLLSGVVGALLILVTGLILFLQNRPDLDLWHSLELQEEFTADCGVETFAAYLAREAKLFEELEEKIYAVVGRRAPEALNRYFRGSRSDPKQWSRDWNRTFEFSVENPRAGAVLIHGMSDSPYSMRSIAERLHAAGVFTVGLRVPGHGTIPSGLVDVEWEDMEAAVILAVQAVKHKIGERPLHLVGYSNGGALSVAYSLRAVVDPALPLPSSITVLSPEIGITSLAALAKWQARLGNLLGLSKLAWNSILPEFDPFKYQSFALNAGRQAYSLTQEIQARITRLEEQGKLLQFPPVLAFQSVVDSTVTATALVHGLMNRLPGEHNQLVLFDMNRNGTTDQLLNHGSREAMKAALNAQQRNYAVSVLTNAAEDAVELVLKVWLPGAEEPTITRCAHVWPEGLYSLSHVALPFPQDDPLYGGRRLPEQGHVRLGHLALYGEKGVLTVPASDILRLRWNPFHELLLQRMLEFMQLGAPAAPNR